ncbi:unnamed protein product, partial [Lymnaea stagnalis]
MAQLTSLSLTVIMTNSPILLSIIVIIFFYLVVCNFLYVLILLKVIPTTKTKISSGDCVLLITAHPDDECMFFSPALLDLSQTCEIHVICTTTGDYCKQGAIRKKELLKSCQILGIPKQHVQVFDDSSFPDDPKAIWDAKKLLSKILACIKQIQPNHILTFDAKGVSGHPNHIAVSEVIISSSFFWLESPQIYQLESISLLRKYLGILDLPCSLASGHPMFVLSPLNILKAQ